MSHVRPVQAALDDKVASVGWNIERFFRFRRKVVASEVSLHRNREFAQERLSPVKVAIVVQASLHATSNVRNCLWG